MFEENCPYYDSEGLGCLDCGSLFCPLYDNDDLDDFEEYEEEFW